MHKHRHLWRAARRSFADYRTPINEYSSTAVEKVLKNCSGKAQPSRTRSASREYIPFRRRCQLGTTHAQLQIVNALRLGERERAYELLSNLGAVNGSLTADDFTYILNYCAEAPDPLFAMETWKILEEKTIDVNNGCCRSILRALSKGGYLKEAFDFLSFAGEKDFAQTMLPLYNIFLSECGNKQSFVDAGCCMELMEGRLVGKCEITYWELLKLAVLQKNVSAAHDLWQDCIRYYTPSILTLRKFIWSFTRLKDLKSAYMTLQHMVVLATRESASLRISTSGRYQSSRIDIPIPSVMELPNEILWSKESADSLNFPNEETRKTKEGLMVHCMNQTNEEKQSLRNNCENLILGNYGSRPSHVPGTTNTVFSEDISTGVSNVLQKANQEDLSEPSLENINQGMGFGVLKQMASLPIRNILRWSFNDVIHACARSNNYNLAEHVFMQMHDLGLEPSAHTYDGFMKAVLSEKGIAFGMKVIETMEKRNIEPKNDTLAALSTAHSENFEVDLAEALLRKISYGLPKYIHAFNNFLAACDVMDQPERAVRILAKMKHLNIKSNIRTYELLFSLFGNVNIPYEKGNMLSHADAFKRINTIEKDMIGSGVQHSLTSMKNLLRALGAEGMTQEMLRYLDIAENILWNTDCYERTDLCNIVLHAHVEAKDSQKAIEIFKRMRYYGFPANVATYNMMIECCSLLTCFKSACAVVSIMLRDGFFPQKLTYTALVKVLLSKDDFDGALALLDQAISGGAQLDIQLFNTILEQAYLKGRIDIIELIIEFLRREKIQPDPSTCWYTFSAYVECGFESTGIEALQVLSMRMISAEEHILQEQRTAFEDLVYSEDPDAEEQIFEIFKEYQEFLATALLSLRWCAINGLLISWSPEESQWAKRLSSSYAVGRYAT